MVKKLIKGGISGGINYIRILHFLYYVGLQALIRQRLAPTSCFNILLFYLFASVLKWVA